MYLHEFREFHGRTLTEIAETTGRRPDGYSVFSIWDDDDPLGYEVGVGFSVADIIREHPEVANWTVKYTNNYLGMIVLRVVKPVEG
jgi:hypothetical protein